MKKGILVLVAFVINWQLQAQIKVTDIAKIFDKYQQDLDASESKGKSDSQKLRLSYNPRMLNMFMANNISNYISSSKDISLQKYYAVLESGDGSLFLGYNFMFRKDKIDRLRQVFNVGIKTNMENNFSALLVNDNVNPELALNLKYSYIFRGAIRYYPSHKDAVKKYRDEFLKKKYAEILKKYEDTGPAGEDNTDIEARLKYATNLSAEEKQELIDDEYTSIYQKIAEDEEKFITENKMFNSIILRWINLEGYLPVANKKYEVAPSLSIFNTIVKEMYNFNVSVSYTRMQKWKSKQIFYTTGTASIYNINNIINKELKIYKFETIVNQGGNNQTVSDTKDAYVGVYKSGTAISLKAELIGFIYKDITGLSVAGELVYGPFTARNWKFGIPFSLKDKDDKPSVNLELQLKEVFGVHSIGISVGYVFGRFFK